MKPIIEVVAALIIADGRILAAQRGTGEFQGLWEFPGGKIEAAELPETALLREIKEELDLDIEVGELFRRVRYEYETFNLSMRCYICRPACEAVTLREHLAYAWLAADELASVVWLPADREVVGALRERLT